jgi:peroxidase
VRRTLQAICATALLVPGPASSEEMRSIDGVGNNLVDESMGATNTPLLRMLEPDYGDGMASLAGAERQSARAISNLVNTQRSLRANPLGATDFLWQWGQFLDHDIDLTEPAAPGEQANVEVPLGDPHFDPLGTGTAEIVFERSVHDPTTGINPCNPRQQLNGITSWIDASAVYGSDAVRADALQMNDGTGRLRTSPDALLPFNTAGLPNAGGTGPELFLAGDVRANENASLTALHTLFVREHNRHARRLRNRHRSWSGERLYQKARQLVGAEIQAITYEEFLPALLGSNALRPYRGYDATVDARIANVFSTAAYRFGHSALSPQLLRLDRKGRPIAQGPLPLRDAFFSPQRIIDEGGIEPLLRGLAAQPCERIDLEIVDDVRNFLFGPPGAGGLDLAALNIQRGRDHGLPSYNDARAAFGFPRAGSFSGISSDPDTIADLAAAYATPDDVDLWVGGLAEDLVPGSHLGELFHHILVDQFEALRDGDRFWYEITLTKRERRGVRRSRLSRVIRRNTRIGGELQKDVFALPR